MSSFSIFLFIVALHEEIHVEVNKTLSVDLTRFSSDQIPLAAVSDAFELFLQYFDLRHRD